MRFPVGKYSNDEKNGTCILSDIFLCHLKKKTIFYEFVSIITPD